MKGVEVNMKRGWKIIITVAAIAIVAALYYLFDPMAGRWAPKCMFHAMTGLDCPGCGSQRMLHALLHGDISAAWHANAFILCMLPVIALLVFAAATRKRLPRLYAVMNSMPSILIIFGATIAWTILRNIF